jgi:acetone carboxylase gamma subunit
MMSAYDRYDKELIANLIDGKLPWEMVKSIMSSPKDRDRFDKYVEILQDGVSWLEKILLPLGEHLYIVEKQGQRIVKCDCGYEFGDYRQNWKLRSLISVRDTEEKLDDIYPGPRKPAPSLSEVREFYCPGCGTQLEVEAVLPGYPITFSFLPDLDAFYSEWLGRPLPYETEFRDMTYDVTEEWAEKE